MDVHTGAPSFQVLSQLGRAHPARRMSPCT